MSSQQFRNLDIDLPKEPTVDQRPWLIAGIVLVCIILLLTACAYFFIDTENGRHYKPTGYRVSRYSSAFFASSFPINTTLLKSRSKL